MELQKDDWLLLCSDGLTRELNEEAIREILAGGNAPDRISAELIAAANDVSGSDNITAIVARILALEDDAECPASTGQDQPCGQDPDDTLPIDPKV